MPRAPLHVPVPLRLSPAVLYALQGLLHDAVTADRFMACLEDCGVAEDASEDALGAVLVEVQRTLDRAQARPVGHAVAPKVFGRPVVAPGAVWIVGRPYAHPDLVEHAGRLVKCRFVQLDGEHGPEPGAEVTTFAGAPICVATLTAGLELFGIPAASLAA